MFLLQWVFFFPFKGKPQLLSKELHPFLTPSDEASKSVLESENSNSRLKENVQKELGLS